jgi:putative ABC transport system permease protein
VLAEHARAFPAVTAATAGPLPLVRGSDFSYGRVFVEGVPQDLAAPLDVVYAGSDYFRTLGQPILRGREFEEWDRMDARRVAIINEAAARQFWPDQDPLERQISVPAGFSVTGAGERVELSRDFVVVGVVRDAKLRNLPRGSPSYICPGCNIRTLLQGSPPTRAHL